MIKKFFSIRIKQLYREIIRIGFFRIFVLLIISFLLFGFLYLHTSSYPNSIYTSIAFWLLLFVLHNKREDKLFLRINFNGYKWIYFVEYLLLSSVLIVFLAIHGNWYLALLTVAILGVIAQIDFKRKPNGYNTLLQKWIPNECFEWKSGVRKLFPIIVSIWVMGISFSFFVASVPLAMVIIGFISLNFLEKGEPYQMIMAYEKDPNKFLVLKIKQQLAIILLIWVPLVISFLIFHYHLWYVPLIILSVFSILIVYAILVKYSFYEPNSKSAAAQTFVAIGVVGFLLPIIAPLIILLSIRFYIKAKQNLSYYLNDYY